MAKDDRLEVAWATFNANVRLSASSDQVRGLVRSDRQRLYFGLILGQPFLIVEDPSTPGTVPWHSVASVGWVTPPIIEGATPKAQVLK